MALLSREKASAASATAAAQQKGRRVEAALSAVAEAEAELSAQQDEWEARRNQQRYELQQAEQQGCFG
eukprot:206912-Chlamydomonas_euryale.AAC.1